MSLASVVYLIVTFDYKVSVSVIKYVIIVRSLMTSFRDWMTDKGKRKGKIRFSLLRLSSFSPDLNYSLRLHTFGR